MDTAGGAVSRIEALPLAVPPYDIEVSWKLVRWMPPVAEPLPEFRPIEPPLEAAIGFDVPAPAPVKPPPVLPVEPKGFGLAPAPVPAPVADWTGPPCVSPCCVVCDEGGNTG